MSLLLSLPLHPALTRLRNHFLLQFRFPCCCWISDNFWHENKDPLLRQAHIDGVGDVGSTTSEEVPLIVLVV